MPFEPTVFPGQAPLVSYSFRTGDGKPTEAIYALGLLIKGGADQPIEVLGTAFYITVEGIFLTAKHVLMDVFDEDWNQTHPVTLIQFFPGRVFKRPVTSMLAHRVADVVIGIPAAAVNKKTREPLRNKIMPLRFTPPPLGAYVASYNFPRPRITVGTSTTEIFLEPRLFDGVVREAYLNGRDRSMLPGPCLETSLHIHGGASGGPVFGDDGAVFAVNSTGIDGTDTGFVSLIECIREMHLENARYTEDETPRSLPIAELIRNGKILVR